MLKRLCLAVAASAAVCGCGSREVVTRVLARPSPPTVAIEPGEHRLGLGSRMIGAGTGRDGMLYVPRSARSGPVPLLILLHGGGGRADYFRFAFPLGEQYGVVVVTIDARDNTWDAIDSPWGPDVVFLDTALRHIFERVAIDPRKIALGGVSDGGMYALSLGMANGDLFTHLIAVAPGFISLPAPPVGQPRIFLAHGRRDNVYSVAGSRRMATQLKEAGYDVTYQEFDGPHSMTAETTRQGMEWLIR